MKLYNNFILEKKFLKISKIDLDKICSLLGLNSDNIKYLSSGSFGNAYRIDDLVLKITTDIREANDVSKIVNKNIPGIINYKKIIKYNGKHNTVYCILMDYVKPLTKYITDKNSDIESVDDLLNILCVNWNNITNFESYYNLVLEYYKIEEDFYYSIIKKIYDLYKKLKNRFQTYPDLHVNNIGIDNNDELVMFDYNKLENYRKIIF